MELGTRIRQRRNELNLTQAQLAEGICTQSQVSKIEKNEMVQEAIELSYRYMDVISLPEFIYVKNIALKHMDHKALINKEELTLAIHLARKQRKLEMIQLLSEI